jgi:hypothetical protein
VSFTETAPYRFRNSVDLAITPEQLFEVLADAESCWRRNPRGLLNLGFRRFLANLRRFTDNRFATSSQN